MNRLISLSVLSGIPLFFSFLILSSCSSPTAKTNSSDSVVATTETAKPQASGIEAKTFDVLDSNGRNTGWGYDLYVDGKRAIHQPHIPAIAGNNPFKTQNDAQRVGDLAASKMRAGSGLPTISLSELDSLNIKP
ncbi:MAG: DUF4907 domain-containing protein [Bacteroidia bacterium]